MMIYLSGKITGDKNYKEKFSKMAGKLVSFGYDVFNPAILPSGLEYEQYMKLDFMALSYCDTIFLLDDWEQSKGAKRELEEARRLGLNVITEDDLLFMETLFQICRDSDVIVERNKDVFQEDDEKQYDEHLTVTSNMIRSALCSYDFSKSKEENFRKLCNDIPEMERNFFYNEFLKEAHILIDYDYIEEDSVLQREKLKNMYDASQKMRDICADLYGFKREERFSMSA